MRRYTTSWDQDPPEAVVAERIEAIAYDLERIADALEDGEDDLVTDGGRILNRESISDRERVAAQQDVAVRLEQIRDDVDDLLADDAGVDVDDVEAVIFGIADGGAAEARGTQEPDGSSPPALLRILGELIDGVSQTSGLPPRDIAEHAIRIIEASKQTDEYRQDASHSRGSS